MIVVTSSDGETFEVEEAVATQSKTIKQMIKDKGNCIVLPNVTSRTLKKVIEYCKRRVNGAAQEELKTLIMKVDQRTLYDLNNAANYLDIKSLFDLTCQTRGRGQAIRGENRNQFLTDGDGDIYKAF